MKPGMVAGIDRIVFRVFGEPKGQPRSRSFVLRGKGGKPILKGGKPIVRTYDPHTSEGWKSQIAEAVKPFIPAEPWRGPVRMRIEFYMPRPKGHYGKRGLRDSAPRYHTIKPDLKNLLSAVEDTLKTLGVYMDDCQLMHEEMARVYCPEGQKMGAAIELEHYRDLVLYGDGKQCLTKAAC